MNRLKGIILLCISMAVYGYSQGQSYHIFSEEVKKDYPSVVYDFLERYLYEIDSIASAGEPIMQHLHDDKVIVTEGDISVASLLTPQTPYTMSASDDRYYQVGWFDTIGNVMLGLAFPMQYELLLGKPKVQIEKEVKQLLPLFNSYTPVPCNIESLRMNKDSVWEADPTSFYYIESLNTGCYYRRLDSNLFRPIFDSSDLWRSAANLFQGVVDSIDSYKLYVEQNLYGYQKDHYMIGLRQWLAYCQAMKLDIYFGVEEEREDGLKALLIAHSRDLGFNHMMSLIISDNFVSKSNIVIKATLE